MAHIQTLVHKGLTYVLNIKKDKPKNIVPVLENIESFTNHKEDSTMAIYILIALLILDIMLKFK